MMTDDYRKLYAVFDPNSPLEAKDNDLYVDLDQARGDADVIGRIEKRIIQSRDVPTCQLLAGHRGCGKSTELRRLQRCLEIETAPERWFVVFVQSLEDIDPNDVDFPEVLICVMRQLAAELKGRADISLKPGYVKDRLQRLRDLLFREVNFDQLDLDAVLGTISTSVKDSPDARLKIRQYLEPDTSKLLHAANDLIGEATLALADKGYKGLVLIIDDLDKMITRQHPSADCTTSEYLFVHRHAQITGFACHTVYSVPLSLANSKAEAKITSLYGVRTPVIPMVKIAGRPPERRRYAPGWEHVEQMIERRLAHVGAGAADVFSGTTRDALIRLSGGQPRELMMLMREAMIVAVPITPEAVERVAREGRRAYARQLRQEDWPILQEVAATGTLNRSKDNDDTIRELLDARAVLQYINEDEWYDVNPLIEVPASAGRNKPASRAKARPRPSARRPKAGR